MPKSANPFKDYVFNLSPDDFKLLQEAVDSRIDKEKYGATSFEEAAILYSREPICPGCGSKEYHLYGKTAAGHVRYRCEECDNSYTLLSD